MDRRVVVAPVETELRGISLEAGVLNIEVRHADLPISALEGVQTAVSVFFQQVEEGGVVLEAVGAQVAKDTNAILFIGKDEAAEVGGELLDSGADGDEIIVRAKVL